MRRLFLSLAIVTLIAGACGSAASSGGYNPAPPDPQHRNPTAAPRDAASPYDGVTYEDPGINPITDTDEDRIDVRHGRRRRLRIAQICRRRLPERQRRLEWSMPSGRLRTPEDETFAVPSMVDHRRSSPTATSCFGSGSRPADRRSAPDPTPLTFVIDTSGSMGREDRLDWSARSASSCAASAEIRSRS
jgi:hypothetical protein